MRTIAVCVLAVFAVAMSCAAPSEAESAAGSVSLVEDRDALMKRMRLRSEAISAELKQLGSRHPWAGVYGFSDCGFLTLPGIRMAPNAGFVAWWGRENRSFGWGNVDCDGDRIHLRFEQISRGHTLDRVLGDYVIVRDGAYRDLHAVVGAEVLLWNRPLDFDYRTTESASESR